MATVNSAFSASATASAMFNTTHRNGAFSAGATAQATFSSYVLRTQGFPYKQLGLKVEVLLNGTWTDITKYVMVRDPVNISPFGRTDETSGMQAGQLTMTLKNTDGRFTPNNPSGAYYPYIQLNTRLRLSVTDQSVTGVNYNGYRFWGEVSEWPVLWDKSGRDVSAPITVSGIWRRLSQGTATIGSPFTRWNNQLASSFTVAAYWPMEDGPNSTTFAEVSPAPASAMTIIPTNGTPSLASCTAFPGSDAIPQLNGAEFSGVTNASSNPTTIIVRFLLFVQSGGDTGAPAGPLARIHLGNNTSLNYVDVALGPAGGGPFTITGRDSGQHIVFQSTLNDVIWGKPIMCQIGLVKSGSNVIWSFNTILPNTTTWYGTTTGTATGVAIADVSSVIFSPGAQWKGISVGQAIVFYGNPSITTDASALGGWNGENALTRFKRICAEQGIAAESIGTTSTAMGPQIDDTLVNILQTVEDTDGGFIYETRDQFGLGYRTMASLQNQSQVMSLDYSTQVAADLTPINDDALIRNDVTLTNYNGYAVRVFLQNGARSIQNPPSGVGSGYAYTRSVNSASNTQVNALGSQILNNGTTAENRYPTVSVNLARITTGGLFNKAPSMRQGDYLQVINMPSFMGGGTEKQLVWGWTETLSNYTWTFVYNTVPELPWESSFNPGTPATGQVPGSPVTVGASSTISGAQIVEGAIVGSNVATGAIQGSNIGSSTITATNIATATILGTNIANGSITGNNIGTATIEGANIDVGTITGANLASATITGTNIASGSITGTQIASATITGSNIGSATITGSNIASTTITATQIANATITGTQIANGAITATQIANATITSSQISSSAGITGSQIAGGTITASNITNATITNTQIASGSITGSNIAAGTITGSNLTNATITSVQISNGTITTTQISNSAGITGTQIGSATVAGSNIAAGTITASNIAAGTITATQIAANTITAGKLVGGIVVAGIVDATTITGANLVLDGANGQVLIYSGTPASGNLIGSWSGTAGTDSSGNTYPAGLSVQQGVITGIDIDSTTITNSTFQGDLAVGTTLSSPTINGGSASEMSLVFDQTGGQLLVYSSSTTSVTLTPASTSPWTVPGGVTQLKVECWAAGAGGDGGSTSQGGNGGGGGEYAAENTYSVTPAANIDFFVGQGGIGGQTGNGHGDDGGDTSWDHGGVFANGGQGNDIGGNGSTNTVHHNGGTGGAASGNAGAASGGNSGNATAAGNNGAASTGTSGASAPSGQTGSGTGGAGGSTGANGSSGSGPGGGGGGAGKGSSSSSKTLSYSPVWTGSYYGPDATSNANSLRSTATMYQGGETASGGAANGNQRCVFAFNRTQIASDFSGYTVTSCQIQLKNLHSWYNSGMTWHLDEYFGLGGSAPGTFPSSGYRSTDASGFIVEGATTTYTLSASIAQRFVTSTSNGLGLGEDIAANHPYDLNFYGYFDPSQIVFTITGTISGAGNETAGAGGDGQIKITYTSGTNLIGAVAPVAGTDANSNAYATGFTGQMVAIQPGSSPTAAETWHNFGTLSGAGTFTGTAKYKLMPNNCVRIYVAGSFSGTGTATASATPSGYWPLNTVNFPIIVANVGARAQFNSSGVLAIIVGSASTCSFVQDIPLD